MERGEAKAGSALGRFFSHLEDWFPGRSGMELGLDLPRRAHFCVSLWASMVRGIWGLDASYEGTFELFVIG